MENNWTDVAIVLFPWIGGGAAIVFLFLLLVGTQLANAVLFLLIPWVGENWRRGVLIRPVT